MNRVVVNPSLKGMKYMVVEDDPDTLLLLTKLIQHIGGATVIASNGKDALLKLATEHPDILITDLVMPEMDGYQLCRQVRELEEFSHIPIIVISKHNDVRERVAALRSGADSFISKPVYASELVAVIEALQRFERSVLRRHGLDSEPMEVTITPTVDKDESQPTPDNQSKVEEPSRQIAMLIASLEKRFGAVFQRGAMYYRRKNLLMALELWEKERDSKARKDVDLDRLISLVSKLFVDVAMQVLGAWEYIPMLVGNQPSEQVLAGLKSEDRNILQMIDEQASIKEICSSSIEGVRKTLYILYRFARAGIIKLRDPVSNQELHSLTT
ncbi:response regulator [bacterium]|nr:response regulator [candidate division CSSED10-310 bacterium]